MKIEHFIAGTVVNPVNKEEISLQISHDQTRVIDEPAPHVSIKNLKFAREDVRKIKALLLQAPGITEAIPYDIKMTERGGASVINMSINLMENPSFSRDGLLATIEMIQSLDWLDKKVDAFTYESMYNETGVDPFTIDGIQYQSYQQYFDKKCIYIPYVISTIPNWHDAFLAILGITYVGTELYKAGNEIYKAIAKMTSDPFQWGEIAGLVVHLVFVAALLLMLIGLLNQLINCLIQPLKYHGAMLMSDLLKVTAAKLGLTSQSSIWDQYPYNQIAYLPEKFNPVESPGNLFSLMGFNVGGYGTKGYTSPAYAPTSLHDSQTPGIQHGYFNGTGGEFLNLLKRFCNGKILIPHATNNLIIERRDFYPASTPYKMQNLRQDWYSYNTDEMSATTIIKFLRDLNERNSIDFKSTGGVPFYPGTVLQATHQQITTVNQALVALQGLKEITIPAARGVAKDKLTFIEQAIKDLEPVWAALGNILIGAVDAVIIAADVVITIANGIIFVLNAIIAAVVDVINVVIDIVDAISSLFGGDGPDKLNVDNFQIPSIPTISPISFIHFSNNFSNRINALLVENDMIDVPKLLLVDTQRSDFTNGNARIAYIHPDNAKVINAEWLMKYFYFIDGFSGSANQSNNRRTLFSPALNSPDEKNHSLLSLNDFLNLVYNPQCKDPYNETVVVDSVNWFIHRNGMADFEYRKNGWLADPNNTNAILRSQEIYNNLTIKITVPNGQ